MSPFCQGQDFLQQFLSKQPIDAAEYHIDDIIITLHDTGILEVAPRVGASKDVVISDICGRNKHLCPDGLGRPEHGNKEAFAQHPELRLLEENGQRDLQDGFYVNSQGPVRIKGKSFRASG